MKRIIMLIGVFILMVGCTQKAPSKTLKAEGIQPIDYETLKANLNADVQFLLYIGRPDCGDCQAFYPVLEKYIQDNPGTGIYYLNIKDFRDRAKSSDASQSEKDFYDNLYKELHFDWVPTIHVIRNGEFEKTYQYLDEDYMKIKDKQEQAIKKQEFIDDFQTFMDDYFKEVSA